MICTFSEGNAYCTAGTGRSLVGRDFLVMVGGGGGRRHWIWWRQSWRRNGCLARIAGTVHAAQPLKAAWESEMVKSAWMMGGQGDTAMVASVVSAAKMTSVVSVAMAAMMRLVEVSMVATGRVQVWLVAVVGVVWGEVTIGSPALGGDGLAAFMAATAVSAPAVSGDWSLRWKAADYCNFFEASSVLDINVDGCRYFDLIEN